MEPELSYGIVPVLLSKTERARFLLIHHVAGHWAFPKGHAEIGERPIETALRELQEETGISSTSIIKDFSYSEKYNFEEDGKTIEKLVTFYLGSVPNDTVIIKRDEVQNSGWFEYEAALGRITHPSNKELLKAAAEKLMSLNYQI